MTSDNHTDAALSEFIGEEGESILKTLETDWRELCGNTLRPTIEGLSPTNIMQDALPYAFVLKRTTPGQAIIRVAGQKVHDAFKTDLATKQFEDLFSERSRSLVSELMETAFTLPAIVSIPLLARRSLGRRSVRAQVLLLPMRDPMGNVTRIMGALVTDGTPCPHPLKFELDLTQSIRCDQQLAHFPDRRSNQRNVIDLAPKRGYLRLVVDNG